MEGPEPSYLQDVGTGGQRVLDAVDGEDDVGQLAGGRAADHHLEKERVRRAARRLGGRATSGLRPGRSGLGLHRRPSSRWLQCSSGCC